MKKILSLVLCLMMALSLAGVAGAEGIEIKVWVPEATLTFTQEQIDAFKAANPDYADITVTLEPVGEGDAASNLITDVEGGADIYNFAQDQLSRLVAAGALLPLDVEGGIAAKVIEENDAASVTAASVGEELYAYPLTSDNGYFLYYDKSVVTDPSSLEQILADCEAAGKNFYMEINSGWYQTAFFFGAGATLTYETDLDANFVACNCDYASENGVKALKAMIETAKSPAFVNGSSVSNATNLGAIVSGTWDSKAAQETLGENFAVAKLPTVGGFQLGGFSGNKLLGTKPQTDDAKLAACDALAYYLASGDVQLARYQAAGWGPSNVAAQQNEAVKADLALSALVEQAAFTIPQGQYPGDYWTLATALGDDVLADKYDEYTDEQLMEVLTTFQNTAASYAAAN